VLLAKKYQKGKSKKIDKKKKRKKLKKIKDKGSVAEPPNLIHS
jgi:hypothetical protein